LSLDNTNSELFNGLHELVASSFPKSCSNCGRLFVSAEQFLSETQDFDLSNSDLKESVSQDGFNLAEAFRKCPCGSTLVEEFGDRRVQTEKGKKRRKTFGRMLAILEKKGVDSNVAKSELIKATHGKRSELVEKYLRIKGAT
jgi:hypothetical protein